MKNPPRFFLLWPAFWLTAVSAFAEPAQTIRDTDLQAQSQSDSAVLASLPGNTHLDVLLRKGAWSQVKTSANQTGWVRMMSLRFDTTATPAKSDGGTMSALTGLLTSGRTSNSGTVTTGVKGLGEEDLKNAQPNPQELQKMEKLAVDKATAQAFAQKSKLAANKVDYLPDTPNSQSGRK